MLRKLRSPSRVNQRPKNEHPPPTHTIHTLSGLAEEQGPLIHQPLPAARLAHILNRAATDLWDVCTLADAAQMWEKAHAIASCILAACPGDYAPPLVVQFAKHPYRWCRSAHRPRRSCAHRSRQQIRASLRGQRGRGRHLDCGSRQRHPQGSNPRRTAVGRSRPARIDAQPVIGGWTPSEALATLHAEEQIALVLTYRDRERAPAVALAIGCSIREVSYLVPAARRKLAEVLDRLDLL